MPRKISVHTEQILDAAFDLVRREGMGALTARRVAQEVGCSTQPVYRAYGSMEQLVAEVIDRAEREMMEYLLQGADGEQPFLQMGLGNLRFAREEPELYMAVTRHGKALRDLQRGASPPPEVLQQMRATPPLDLLTDEQLTRVNALMWFFSQGLAHLVLAATDEDPMPRAQEYLEQAGRAVIASELAGISSGSRGIPPFNR